MQGIGAAPGIYSLLTSLTWSACTGSYSFVKGVTDILVQDMMLNVAAGVGAVVASGVAVTGICLSSVLLVAVAGIVALSGCVCFGVVVMFCSIVSCCRSSGAGRASCAWAVDRAAVWVRASFGMVVKLSFLYMWAWVWLIFGVSIWAHGVAHAGLCMWVPPFLRGAI